DRVPRPTCSTRRTSNLRILAQITVPSGLGCLFQTSLRWSRTRVALSRRLHPPRRHLQPQAGCPRRRQCHLPLERLRSRQQEAAPDPTGRRVPTPLPPAPAPARLHAHPQLRLPRQPATRHAPAALLPTAPRRREQNCFTSIAARRSASVAMELSRLRRNHARR